MATMLWSELLVISLTVFSANLHPTEAPKIKRQKLIDESGLNVHSAVLLQEAADKVKEVLA